MRLQIPAFLKPVPAKEVRLQRQSCILAISLVFLIVAYNRGADDAEGFLVILALIAAAVCLPPTRDSALAMVYGSFVMMLYAFVSQILIVISRVLAILIVGGTLENSKAVSGGVAIYLFDCAAILFVTSYFAMLVSILALLVHNVMRK